MVPDPSVYGTHSFRPGGATKAANSVAWASVFFRGMGGKRVFQSRMLCLLRGEAKL